MTIPAYYSVVGEEKTFYWPKDEPYNNNKKCWPFSNTLHTHVPDSCHLEITYAELSKEQDSGIEEKVIQ